MNTHQPTPVRTLLFSLALLVAAALPLRAADVRTTLMSEDFEKSAPGQLPEGWSLPHDPTYSAAVLSDVANAPSGKRALRIASTGVAPKAPMAEPELVIPFEPRHMDGKNGTLEYSLDINVESIAGNDSEGIQLRITAPTSRIDVASPRILKGDNGWRLYAHGATPDGIHYFGKFEFGRWVKLRFVIEPTSGKAGKTYWYADGTLINTEVYNDRNDLQTQSVQRLEISPVHAIENTNTVLLIDNIKVTAGERK